MGSKLKMILSSEYRPKHTENRMKHEGDVENARKLFLQNRNRNLHFLLKNRYDWMNQFIGKNDRGIEVGGGTGISQYFIRSNNYQVTDFAKFSWLDIKNIDALNTKFKTSSLDFVVSSNMIHHVPFPMKFFKEMHRILKPGGLLLVQEINASLMMRVVLRLMRHEGYSYAPDVFNPKIICTDPKDLWSANCAIPNLLFDNKDKFNKNVKGFKIVRTSFSELVNFLNSGGVIAKTIYVPLPRMILIIIKLFDDFLTNTFPQVFALQRQIVLRKIID